ncbi:MAG: glycine cleavage system protein GcvH [Thermoprotei archaeon]|nr:MAG: glycine cleavage system protein GcvH [Thermoprotei archaeon]
MAAVEGLDRDITYKEYVIKGDRRYAETHEWIKIIEGRRARIGISDYAQKKLKSVVYVEPVETPKELKKGELITTVESIKAVGEIYAPVDCVVIAYNSKLDEDPGVINTDPYGEGWIVEVEVKDPKDIEGLLTAMQYVEEVLKKEE